MKKINSFILFLLISIMATANDFDIVVDQILESNPTIQNEIAKSNAEYLYLRTENNFANPDISFEALFGEFGENKFNVGVSQSFDWPSLYKARSRQSESWRIASESAIAETKNQIQLEASTILASIVTSQNKIELYQQIADKFSDLLTTYEAEYQRGNVSILDVNKLRVEVADNLAALENEQLIYDELLSSLSILSGSADFESQVSMIDIIPHFELNPLETYINSALTNSPKIAAINARRDLAEREINVTSASNLPGFSLGYRYSYEGLQNFHGFSFGMTLPTWGNQGKKIAAKAALTSVEIEQNNTIIALKKEIERDYNKAVILKKQINRYGNALITSDNLGMLLKAYEGGQLDLTAYIQDVSYFLNAQIQLHDLQLQLATTIFRLNSY